VTARLKLERYNIKTARKRLLEHGPERVVL